MKCHLKNKNRPEKNEAADAINWKRIQGKKSNRHKKIHTHLSISVCKCHDMLNDFKFWSRALQDS